MTIAVVLASISGEAGSEAVMSTALSVGRSFDAHVELLHVTTSAEDTIPLMGETMSQSAIAQMIEAAEQAGEARAKAARELFARHCPSDRETNGVGPVIVSAEENPPAGVFSATWREPNGHGDAEIARRGRLADLIVMARGDQRSGPVSSLEAALFDCGHPVLIAPPQWQGELGRRVALAWNDTREAARGLAAALPFLRAADEIVLVTVQKGKDEAGLAAVQAYLACHGIEAEAQIVDPAGKGVGDCLLQVARDRNCDLLVMGAYGHSRLREFILGGATETALASAEIPVLMAH